MRPSAPATTATDTFTKLEWNFNICAIASTTSCKGIHLNHQRDSDACKSGHPIFLAEPSGNQRTAAASRGLLISFLIIDNKQAEPSRPFTFTLTQTKHFYPLSDASATGKETQHNISGLSSFFGNVPTVISEQQIKPSPQSFHQLTDTHQLPLLQPPLPYSNNISSHQPSLSLLHS